ncbi:MAG: two-component system, NarL family, sensor kinase [Solirubrobacteraceae bacterium]|nr:two-component system, NarL family, sensor kinase [Solirubrobacteraceae bacterium]
MRDSIANDTGSQRSGNGVVERSTEHHLDPSLARLYALFALTGLAAMVIIGAVAFVILRHSATTGAVSQAKELTQLAGRGIAEPLITPGVLRGSAPDLARLDRAVRARILSGTPIVRVKIWDARGRVIYSDAPHLIGSVFSLGKGELSTLRDGGTEADASDLTRPENRTEQRFQRLVEVYVGIRGPGGARLLYEDYERSSTISASSRRQWVGLLPALLGALLVLYLIQVPLAYSLARRLRAKQREREELLRRAIDASDLERRRVAADLHDGAVQRLAGVSLSLSALAGGNGGSDGEGMRQAVAGAAAETRETIRELRTLLVDIYPPTLQRSGLLAALSDLVAPLKAAGIAVTLRMPESIELPDHIEALFYRVAQEAIRNTRMHSKATRVEVCVEAEPNKAVLSVIDDGLGFLRVTADEREQDRHFGLRLMRDLVDHAGGELDIASSPGNGASVRLEVPLR